MAKNLRAKVGDLRQFASVRRIVLDDGVERGVAALAFSNGGGLDFWALADRSLDIGPLWWKGMPVAWQSMAGFRSPHLHHPEEDDGRGYSRTNSGFLVTCGLDHIRQPIPGHPMHGRLPFTPARVMAHGEDWDRGEPLLFCEGEIMQFQFGGEALRLRRRIEVPIGANVLRIRDVVTNLAREPAPQASLYHINFGYPALAPGSSVRLGSRKLVEVKTLPDPSSVSESVSYPADGDGACGVCRLTTPTDNGTALEVAVSFDTNTLPHLQLWHDLRPHACVLAIEPCTSAKMSGAEAVLHSGESRTYSVEICFTMRSQDTF
ncbi:DUF4432 family protein [Bradyrhizobium liaoningense]|uniref:DUF4432 family protein n=1 Tax=Bradyrhizobium liaoningense TaxID=43992 RepID=UPI001BA4EC57|nr:DUF4432 family protein [Bradyrhizobium liaoningense]MBR0854111.1 DUF4432 family protein [Bradyrhizobium liaoningense]